MFFNITIPLDPDVCEAYTDLPTGTFNITSKLLIDDGDDRVSLLVSFDHLMTVPTKRRLKGETFCSSHIDLRVVFTYLRSSSGPPIRVRERYNAGEKPQLLKVVIFHHTDLCWRLFFLPTVSTDTTPLPAVLDSILTQYNPTPLPRWTLEHRLFKETPKQNENGEPRPTQAPRYLQLLNLSHHPEFSYITTITTQTPQQQSQAPTPASSAAGFEGSGEPAVVTAIPSGPSTEAFFNLLVSKFGPLWTQRQSLCVTNGQAFDIAGNFRVLIGEVKQGLQGTQLGRGVVVEVQWLDDEGEEQWDEGEEVIRAFWASLGLKGAKECLHVAGKEDGFVNVRQWCEILRLRS